jgi:hypothetical protein
LRLLGEGKGLLLKVLHIHDGRAVPAGQGHGEPFYYRGERPRVIYRLRLGVASLLTAEPDVVARAREQRRDVRIETIPVVDAAPAT